MIFNKISDISLTDLTKIFDKICDRYLMKSVKEHHDLHQNLYQFSGLL